MAGPAAFHEQKGHLIEVGVLKGGALIPVDIGGRGFGSVIHHHYLKNQPFSRPFPLLALGATRSPPSLRHTLKTCTVENQRSRVAFGSVRVAALPHTVHSLFRYSHNAAASTHPFDITEVRLSQ